MLLGSIPAFLDKGFALQSEAYQVNPAPLTTSLSPSLGFAGYHWSSTSTACYIYERGTSSALRVPGPAKDTL